MKRNAAKQNCVTILQEGGIYHPAPKANCRTADCNQRRKATNPAHDTPLRSNAPSSPRGLHFVCGNTNVFYDIPRLFEKTDMVLSQTKCKVRINNFTLTMAGYGRK